MKLHITTSQVKILMFGRENRMNDCKLYIYGQNQKQVNEFVCLSKMFAKAHKKDEEILRYANAD